MNALNRPLRVLLLVLVLDVAALGAGLFQVVPQHRLLQIHSHSRKVFFRAVSLDLVPLLLATSQVGLMAIWVSAAHSLKTLRWVPAIMGVAFWAMALEVVYNLAAPVDQFLFLFLVELLGVVTWIALIRRCSNRHTKAHAANGVRAAGRSPWQWSLGDQVLALTVASTLLGVWSYRERLSLWLLFEGLCLAVFTVCGLVAARRQWWQRIVLVLILPTGAAIGMMWFFYHVVVEVPWWGFSYYYSGVIRACLPHVFWISLHTALVAVGVRVFLSRSNTSDFLSHEFLGT